MSGEHPELDELQAAYKDAVEAWISAIRKEEALALAVKNSSDSSIRIGMRGFRSEFQGASSGVVAGLTGRSSIPETVVLIRDITP